jgi:hypothetical protein
MKVHYCLKSSEVDPKRQCVIAGFGQHALWQCARARQLDLGLNVIEQRLDFSKRSE